jgi:hypothetical protein
VARLTRPVDVASLVAARIAFGVLMIVAMARYFVHGWIEQLFVGPTIFFPYAGFEWVRPWPEAGMYLHFALLGVLALGIAAGCWYRASAALFCAGFTYAHLIDKSNYLNHYYLVSVVAALLVVIPAHRSFAGDARRRPRLASATVPVWAVWALRAQLGLVYVFGGLAKLNADWLLHAQPLRMWLGAHAGTPLVGAVLEQEWAAYACSWAGALFDLGIVPCLLWRRTRPFAYATVVAFHLMTAWLFPIGMFPWIMIALTTVFFEPAWPRRWLPRAWPGVSQAETVPRPAGLLSSRLVPALLAVHFTLQIALPLRALAYAGNPLWTESGFRFAWRVMVMEKNGLVTFRVRDPETGAAWTVDPRRRLTPLQARMMATQPDMILTFARRLADEARASGHRLVEVRADAYASLNGRRAQRFIDPEIDLLHAGARERWLLPLRDAT